MNLIKSKMLFHDKQICVVFTWRTYMHWWQLWSVKPISMQIPSS